MNYSNKGLAQMIIGDFSSKYLKITDPLDIEEILSAWANKKFPESIENEIYNIDDVKYCISLLAEIDDKELPFGFFDFDNYIHKKTKTLLDFTFDGIYFKISLYDLINSAESSEKIGAIRLVKCKGCGKYFRTTNDSLELCNHEGLLEKTCREIFTTPANSRSDIIYKFQEYLNWKMIKVNAGLISIETANQWQSEAIGKLIECNNGKLSNSDFITWCEETK